VESILNKRNVKGEELPINFISNIVHDYELGYLDLENEALSLVKPLAHFWTYILNSNVIAYVPSSGIKMHFNKQLREGKWVNWI
jgi:hypothetical protein